MEGILDANMISLLNFTPGIIRKQSGVVGQMIDLSDWVKLLTMQDPTMVNAGQWIRVRKGVYKGDLGFVTDVEAWGARVLVVPRLKTPTPQAAASLKRKRTAIKPEPRLFDPDTFSSVFQHQPKHLNSEIYSSRGFVFDHGLLRLELDFHSISLNSTGVPSRILELFNLSSHPSVTRSTFPRPEEWNFEEGERVTVCSSGKEATIAAVKSIHLEVDLATNEGIEVVSWHNVRKIFSAGAFVGVTGGPSKGMMGWVERIVDDTVYLLKYKEEGNLSTSSDDIEVSFILIPADIILIYWFILQRYEFHVNWLTLTTVPFLHTSSTSKADDYLSKADRAPWIGTEVIISKLGSPWKGHTGVVKDVLRGQKTASGLKILIQLANYDPSSPYKTIAVDHDDVVERRSVKDLHLQGSILNMPSSRTGSSLLDYAEPRNILFRSSKTYMKSARRPFGPPPLPGPSTSGGATPMPDQTSSLTPAWDPSSRTPGYSHSYFC